jgi:phosphoribosylformimino-5-aminoimidazole carboxamide ribotide isomerase
MELYARVNILDGMAVRLPYGDIKQVIPLDDDPVNRAKGWVAKGASRLHVVDLNAAADLDYSNRDLIARIIDAVDVPVQVGGGVRSNAEAERVLGMGAWRVVVGTLAIVDQVQFWELNRLFPRRVVVSLDVKPDLEIVIKGWTEETGEYLEQMLIELSSGGAAGFMISEVGRDALVEEPNFEALELALKTVEEPVIVAGGVRNLLDVETLMSLGTEGRRIAGLVVGREVTAGRFSMDDLAEAIKRGGSPQTFGPWSHAELDEAVTQYAATTGEPDVLNTLSEFIRWLSTRS